MTDPTADFLMAMNEIAEELNTMAINVQKGNFDPLIKDMAKTIKHEMTVEEIEDWLRDLFRAQMAETPSMASQASSNSSSSGKNLS